ncbi:NAD(P)-dependent alcohol dehydrogenase [Marispirochaeta sp.]|uniref:NAD(P)-dependent alcohol dehydrogenase n=1 Tax=Marispirochaeta sp. TaxID=2038653 RepID=UPI0029C68594|nr:NAD(P)-dependent alcohol dehydrogenase [Marispirochaeta sp.]
MQAVVLEKKGEVRLRDIDIQEELGPGDVCIRPVAVGVCGSDVHYYREGGIGDFVVREPMVLGHEAAGIVVDVGSDVKQIAVGDRVCMEPGIPDFTSYEALRGMYNLDPAVRFWATPPVHGCLRETVIHPACLTFKLPDGVTFYEGALVEPVAIGVYSVNKAGLSSGDTVLVIGAGTIGIVTALAAEAAGCSRVLLADIKKEKLDFVRQHYAEKILPIDLNQSDIETELRRLGIDGVDAVFEASGSEKAYPDIPRFLKPGAVLVLIGMPSDPVPLDVVGLQVKEITVKTIFRYVNIFPRVVDLIASGKLNVKPLVTRVFKFKDSCAAFEYAGGLPGGDVKIMIDMERD